jgi:hypothetical protein
MAKYSHGMRSLLSVAISSGVLVKRSGGRRGHNMSVVLVLDRSACWRACAEKWEYVLDSSLCIGSQQRVSSAHH